MLHSIVASYYSRLLPSILARFMCRLWDRRLRLTRMRLILPIVSMCLCLLHYTSTLTVLP